MPKEKRNVIGAAISHVGDLAVTGAGEFIEFLAAKQSANSR